MRGQRHFQSAEAFGKESIVSLYSYFEILSTPSSGSRKIGRVLKASATVQVTIDGKTGTKRDPRAQAHYVADETKILTSQSGLIASAT